MTTTPYRLHRLHDVDAATRRIALLQLADEEDADALPAVIALLADDPSPEVRLEAARILATWEQPETVAALACALEDANAAVREAAALGLGELKSPDSAPALLPYVGHADAFVRAAALRGLRELRVPESDAPALNALNDADAAVRREAVTVLGWRKHVAALPALAERARGDADAEVRRAAVGALGLATDASVLPALLDALRDTAWRVREESASTLGKLRALAPDVHVTHALVEALADDYWQVRLQAARALGRWRATHAVDALAGMLSHPISNLRKDAALALGETGDAAALPALRIAESDGDPEVVKAVRIALAQIEATRAAT